MVWIEALILSYLVCATTIKGQQFGRPNIESLSLWDTKEKMGPKTFFRKWGLSGFLSSLAWTKEETVLLSGEWPRTVLGFWMREKLKRRESSSDFSPPSSIFFDLYSTSKKFEVIEGRDQIRFVIKSRLCELALPRRANRFENFVWTIRRGRMLVRIWAIREDF